MSGIAKTQMYQLWLGMKARCYNTKHKSYGYYGGRGVYVCDRWCNSFTNFLADMGYKPKGKTLDRIDGAGPYSPDNCQWATTREQIFNSTLARPITFNGETLHLVEWSERTGIKLSTIAHRLDKYGWTVAQALTTPPKFNGRWHSK